jgi:hypothetical protein
MPIDVQTYLQILEQKKGKLSRWDSDIAVLYRAGVSYGAIAEFLRLNGVTANKMEIYRYVHREKRKHLFVRDGEKPGTPIEAAPVLDSQGELKKSELSPPAGVEDNSRPKFNYKETRNLNKPKW